MYIKNYLFVLWGLLPFFGYAASATAPLTVPKGQLPLTQLLDIQHISMDMRFDWVKKQAICVATITLAPLNDTDQISLDAGFLQISSVRLLKNKQRKALQYDYDGSDRDHALLIRLGKKIRAHHPVTFEITYRSTWLNLSDPNALGGSNGKGLRFLGPTATDPTRRKQVWSMGEPYGNRYWLPGQDCPADFYTSDARITVERGMTAIANGRLERVVSEGDGMQTYYWRCDVPHAHHMSAVVVGTYTETAQSAGNSTLQTYGFPDEVAATNASIVRLPDMVRFFEEKLQTPLPFGTYTQVFVQDVPNTQACAGLSVITENMVDDAPTHAEFYYLWDLTEGEGLANQWFGGHTGCADWRDIWINKAFGRYLSGLYTAHKNSREEYLLYQLTFDQSTYLNDWNNGLRHPIVTSEYTDATSFAADNYPYFRAAAVLHTLHEEIGDAAFWRSLHLFLNQNAHKGATTKDFQQAVEAACGRPMQWFFDQWMYTMGHPDFEVSKQYDAATLTLTMTVRQAQQTDPQHAYPQTHFFEGNVVIALGTQRIETVRILPQEVNTFTFTVRKKPEFVYFDVASAWLKTLKYEPSLEELIAQLQQPTFVLAQNDAIAQLGVIARDSATTEARRQQISAALRQVAEGPSYWRLRWAALAQLQTLIAPAWLTEPVHLDEPTVAMLRRIIERDTVWNRRTAINFLGMTRDPQYAPLYKYLLADDSDRVINAAAAALGKSKAPDAFDALVALRQHPSWKSQSLISALNGLRELGDPRAESIALEALNDRTAPHWTLATPIWDYRVTAAQTLAQLGTTDAAHQILANDLDRAIAEGDLHGIFYTGFLAATLGDPRGHMLLDKIKKTYPDDKNAQAAVSTLEAQWQSVQKK
jgi:aminopeptidase N